LKAELRRGLGGALDQLARRFDADVGGAEVYQALYEKLIMIELMQMEVAPPHIFLGGGSRNPL
jgi:hypothetical protein